MRAFYLGAMIVVFDMEWTSWPGSQARDWSGPGEHPEIIQIGAVRLDADLRETASLDRLVKPKVNPLLSDFIIGLTGITQDRVDRDGIDVAEALSEFATFASGARAVLTNGRDHEIIARNVALHGIANPMAGATFASVSAHFRHAAGRSTHVVSSTLPEVFGFELSGRAHDGLADARAIAEALRRTTSRGGISALITALTNTDEVRA